MFVVFPQFFLLIFCYAFAIFLSFDSFWCIFVGFPHRDRQPERQRQGPDTRDPEFVGTFFATGV